MSQNTVRFELYTPEDVELYTLMREYSPIVWELREEFQCNSVEDFTMLLLNDIPNWDSAIVCYCGDTPMGILVTSGMIHSVYHAGVGVHLLHVFASQAGIGWKMYKYFRHYAKQAGIDWISTCHPDHKTGDMLIKYNKI